MKKRKKKEKKRSLEEKTKIEDPDKSDNSLGSLSSVKRDQYEPCYTVRDYNRASSYYLGYP